MSASRPHPNTKTLLRHHPLLTYSDSNELVFDGVPLSQIARDTGTPTWIISANVLRKRAHALKEAFAQHNLPISCHFAVKSQDHQACLTILNQCGYGADVVSGGELIRALRAGIPATKIVFSGIGKTDEELRLAIDKQIGQINVESKEELFRLNNLASSLGRTIRVAFRVNPDVDAVTHSKITTGRAQDKFGIPYADVPQLYRLAQTTMTGVHLVGLAVHLGSQMLTAEPFKKGFEKIAQLILSLRQDGLSVEDVDCGGGLGIPYHGEDAPEPASLAKTIKEIFGPLNVNLHIEPGRWLSGPAGILLSRVIDIKEATRRFVILDAGMNELIRPAMYDSWHGIIPVKRPASETYDNVDIVGPICESGDTFAKQRLLPTLQRDDLVIFLDAGAYGSVMSSTYNSRPFAAQILVEDGRYSTIRQRQTLEELLSSETVPEWLSTR